MSWFGKSKKGGNNSASSELGQFPELPRPPELPNMPAMQQNFSEENINPPRLPSYPSNSFGERFSQNAIKDAVSGGKEVEKDNDEAFDADEFPEEDEEEMMQKPQKKQSFQDYPQPQANQRIQGQQESVFVRLDKFEEGLHKFNKAKEKILEIEHLVSEMKKANEKEMEELGSWEKEVKDMKKNFEKIDKDIFSKI